MGGFFVSHYAVTCMDNNWARLMENYYWHNVTEVTPNCNDEEISELRRQISGNNDDE